MRKRKFDIENCRLSLVVLLRACYVLNLLLTLALTLLATFKSESLLLATTTWEKLMTPFYFYMTELLLISIVAFVAATGDVVRAGRPAMRPR